MTGGDAMYLNRILVHVFAKVTVLLFIVLVAKWPVRILSQKHWAGQAFFKKLNTLMRRTHIPIGIAMVIAGAIHGYFSYVPLIGLNLASAAWISTVLVAASWVFSKPLNHFVPWIKVHRWLTVLAIVVIIAHVMTIG